MTYVGFGYALDMGEDEDRGGSEMYLEKEAVTARLRADGEYDRAHMAETTLPKHIDPERDAGLLHQFDLNVTELNRELTDG
jgi:hypothetical protein